MVLKFWAQIDKMRVGPCHTRQQAIDLFRHENPPTTPAQRRKQITTGYGEHGPSFSIEWVKR